MFYRVIRVNYWSLYILKNNKILNRLCIVSARIKKFLVWLLVSGKGRKLTFDDYHWGKFLFIYSLNEYLGAGGIEDICSEAATGGVL